MFSAATKSGKAAAASAPSDPYFYDVTLLLSGDGTNGAQNNTFLDGSTNAFTITRNGNTTQGTFSPYSPAGQSWSNYFDGSSAYLTATNNTAYAFGTGDFTVEAWVFLSSAPSSQMVVGSTYQNSSSGFTFSLESNVIKVRMLGDPTVVSGATTITANTWHHVAVSRSGTSLKVFLDGVQDGSATNSDNVALNSTAFNIARLPNNSGFLAGYVSNLRVVKGTAVYTGTFTPSTTPLTAITNTSLLTCQSNRFIDNSTNAFAITVGGTPSVQRFSPFNPTAAYSTSTVGGSGYFDGSGDYLNFSPSTSFAFGTGDFTIEFWMNTGGATAAGAILDSSTNGSYWSIRVGGTTLYYQSASGITNLLSPTISTLSQNAWTHIVVSRVSGTTKIFANGTQVATGSDSTNYTATTTYRVGLSSDGPYYNGYISDIRVVKGSGVTSVTVPTAPLTAITNTSLLLNYTNAGIYDSAMMNDLETVGNAQISTSVKKYGTGSMYFDGSGDYLVSPNIYIGDFLTGDFTIEYWFRCGTQGTSYVTQVGTLDSGSAANSWRFGTNLNTTAGVYFSYHNGSSFVDVTFTTTNYNDNAWHHAALTRSGSTVRAFIDGTQVGSNQTISTSFSARRVVVGAELFTPSYYTGYIDDLRITKGYARYTANFTPPTAALPNY